MSFNEINQAVVFAMHDRQIAEHGGAAGVRDRNVVLAALARPKQRMVYGDAPDAAELAACYAFGLVRGHGFVDGNKRVGWAVTRLFLRLNRIPLAFDAVDVVTTVNRLPDGLVDEEAMAAWLRQRCG